MTGALKDYDPLMALTGDARFVLPGEASHSTHEFYRERAQITKRLTDETLAVEPLERTSEWETGEVRETFTHGV